MKYHFSPMKIQHSLIERYDDSYLSKNVFINFLNLVKKKLSSNIFSKRIGNGKMSASRNATEEYQKFTKIGTQYVFKVLHTCIQLTDLMGPALMRYWQNCMGGLPPHRKKNISSINWVKLLWKGLWTNKIMILSKKKCQQKSLWGHVRGYALLASKRPRCSIWKKSSPPAQKSSTL